MLRDYYRRVVDGLSIAVLMLDRRLRLLFMNAAAETLFELSFRKARKLALPNLIVGVEPFIAGLRHCLENGHLGCDNRPARARAGCAPPRAAPGAP